MCESVILAGNQVNMRVIISYYLYAMNKHAKGTQHCLVGDTSNVFNMNV